MEFFPALHPANHAPALCEGAQEWSYADLERRSRLLATGLLGASADLAEERLAFLLPASLDYTSALLGIWRAGGIAVPLNIHAAVPELMHVLLTAGAKRLLVSDAQWSQAVALKEALRGQLPLEPCKVSDLLPEVPGKLPALGPQRRAMMLFTSGTTSKPKGVVTTHGAIRAQITALLEAWAWRETDAIPLFLPLHHIHGIVNVLCCALWAGARVTLFPKFDLREVLSGVAGGEWTLFMAVPTIYRKILDSLSTLPADTVDSARTGFAAMRLNVSGSAACPVSLFTQWRAWTGQTLLERYGMTELGMALSNPYQGERRAGAVGLPLPGVEVALFDEAGAVIAGEGEPGEIRVRGDNVFLEYWNDPQATAASFREGWFCTGDIAVREAGYYRILGRASVDIIKSGGYKISALEIEDVLLQHQDVAECAVVGVDDPLWGEAVTAFLVPVAGGAPDEAELKHWCKERLSAYKVPRRFRFLQALPRNAMGKVTKPALRGMSG